MNVNNIEKNERLVPDKCNWYFGKKREDLELYKKYDLIKSLKTNDVFILEFKYMDGRQNEYALMRKTDCRRWAYIADKYEYTSEKINIHNMENFYQNFFGLDSNRTFKTLDDAELNLITNAYFGKNANELPVI